jgi:hypothetical protein
VRILNTDPPCTEPEHGTLCSLPHPGKSLLAARNCITNEHDPKRWSPYMSYKVAAFAKSCA